MAAKPKSKGNKPKTTKPKPKTEEYEKTWAPRYKESIIPKIKIRKKSVPLPKISLRGIQEIKQPKTKKA